MRESTQGRPRERHPMAFTLVEFVMVMVIIGIFTAIAAPRYINSIMNYRVKSATQRVVMDLEYARTRAKATSSSRRIEFVLASSRYKIPDEQSFDNAVVTYMVNLRDDPYWTYLHSIDLGGDREFTFDGFGMPDADGAIILRAGDTLKAILIDGVTGEISVEEIDAALVTKLSAKGLVVSLN